MKKRLISILLALCMVLTLLPATVLSAGVGTSKAGDAAFTLSASSASCADGHTGELRSIQVTGVDISKWKSDKRITIQSDVQYRCTDSSCELYDSDDSFFSYSGKHTFTDTKWGVLPQENQRILYGDNSDRTYVRRRQGFLCLLYADVG